MTLVDADLCQHIGAAGGEPCPVCNTLMPPDSVDVVTAAAATSPNGTNPAPDAADAATEGRSERVDLDSDSTPTDVLAREARRRFRLFTRSDLDNITAPPEAIEGLMPAAGLVLLAGSRGLGNSLLSNDWGAHIATGREVWYDRRLTLSGPVLYIALEGFRGIPPRVRAWETVHGVRVDRMVWWPDPIDLRRRSHARMVGAVAVTMGAVLVVVDSARSSGAGAEDTSDMGAYVSGLEAVGTLSGALVLVLHNTGWNEARERGSTILPDACDVTLLLQGDGAPGGIRRLDHRKFRDGEMLAEPIGFTFRRVEGTRSGLLVPGATLPTRDEESARDGVLRQVTTDPGRTTGDLANALRRNRQHVSVLLAELVGAGLVHNRGTKQRPAWHPIEGADLLPEVSL